MARRGLRSWLAFLLSTLILLASIPQSTVAAAGTDAATDESIQMLMDYGIVKGDPNGDLRLNDKIKRAEMAALAIRAVGLEEHAKYITQSTTFTDMKGYEWAIGYATVANNFGLVKGRGNGIFDPGSYITYAEVYTILLRMVNKEPAGTWNPTWIMITAKQVGIAPDDVAVEQANEPALRGAIFRSLARAISDIKLDDGTTILQKFIDDDPPVLTVDSLPETTTESSVTITGTVDSGTRTVTVNGEKATLKDNRFTAKVSLSAGTNTLNIVATDWAGNVTTKTVTVARASNAARISVPSSPVVVKPGASTTIKATAYDSANRALPADAVTAKVSGSIGTYDVATGVFKAGTKAGKGTITFTSGSVSETVDVIVGEPSDKAEALRIKEINTGNILSLNKAVTVRVEVVDDDDEVVTSDYGRKITLAARDLSGVTVSPTTAATVAGVATFTVTASKSGEGSLYATASGLTSDELDITVGSGNRIVLSANPTKVSADGYSDVTIRATLVDEDGDPVINRTGSDIEIELSIPSSVDSFLSESTVIIPEGRSSSSGYDGELIAGTEAETVKVSGRVTSKHSFSVVPTTVTVSATSTGAARAFEIAGGTSKYKPGSTVSLTVRVVDANGKLVTKGSYAFQIQVSTSNNEELVDGVPTGLELYINGNQTPIKDADDAVIARTENGMADLELTYDKSGTVTVKVVGVDPGDEEAVNDEGEWDEASSGKGLTSAERDVRFVGTVSGLDLRVDLPSLGLKDQPIGILSSVKSQSITLKAYAVDDNGGRVTTYTGYVDLERESNSDGITSLTSKSHVKAIGGVAEFTIKNSAGKSGVDVWKASSGGMTDEITIAVNDSKPEPPTVLSMHGENSENGRVSVSDDWLEIEIAGQSTDPYGVIKVYRGSSLIYTSDVLDLTDDVTVRVPKSKLSTTSTTYSVRVNNGYGDSDYSGTFQVVNESPVKLDITKVQFNAGTKGGKDTLVVTASGVAKTGTIQPEHLFIQVSGKSGTRVSLADLKATCTSSTGSFTCTWPAGSLDPETYNGNVLLDTEDGYYMDSNGKVAKRDEDTADNYIRPMAFIESASVDFTYNSSGEVTGASLILAGSGFNQGTIYPDKLEIEGVSLKGVKSSYTPNTSTKVTIPLDSSIAQNLIAITGPASLTAYVGWLKNSSNANLGMEVDTVTVGDPITSAYLTGDSSSLTLTLKGSGLANGTIDPAKLSISDRKGNFVVSLASCAMTQDGDTATIEITGSSASSIASKKGNTTLFLVGDESWFEMNGWPADVLEAGVKSIGWK